MKHWAYLQKRLRAEQQIQDWLIDAFGHLQRVAQHMKGQSAMARLEISRVRGWTGSAEWKKSRAFER